MKIQENKYGGSGWVQGEVRVDLNKELKFCENSKEIVVGGGGRGEGGGQVGGQGGCERRSEVFL